MSAKSGKFYAVKVGKVPGIYTNWSLCSQQVTGFPGSVYKSFKSKKDATDFLGGVKKVSTSNVIYTDGSFSDGRGGYAWMYFSDSQETPDVIGYGPSGPSNNKAELTAILRALKYVKTRPVTLITDSLYSINCITLWKITEGKHKNVELINKIKKISDGVQFQHVKGHSGDRFNDMVDQLANKGRLLEEDYLEDLRLE